MTNETVERIKAGLDLAATLACDVPITITAQRKLDEAYQALAALTPTPTSGGVEEGDAVSRAPMDLAREEWWRVQSRRGDPARNPRLVEQAFNAGWAGGAHYVRQQTANGSEVSSMSGDKP